MRLIDADALSAAFWAKEPRHESNLYTVESIDAFIDDAPTIDPVKHGHWETTGAQDDNDNITTVCSECGHTDTHSISLEIPHCWFCGARMDADKSKVS